MKRFLGVIGGMGPLATADFLRKLVKKTPAEVDQEHIPVLLYGDCTTPDRSANIVGNGESPLPKLLDGIDFLNRNGATAICIPCNSAHCWFDDIQKASHAPILNIVRASAAQVRKKNPNAKSVGVMSTFGTHRMGIYRKPLKDMGFNVICPTDEEFENLISPAIAMVKAGACAEAEANYEAAAARLFDRGADVVVLGCTEIPFSMERSCRSQPLKFVDSNDALVEAVLDLFAAKQQAN